MARSIRLPKLPDRFNRSHALAGSFLTRVRKFDPRSLFLGVLHLTTSTNKEGYDFALGRTWEVQGLNLYETPAKSSFSEARDKVSFEMFAEIFRKDLERFRSRRKTYRGYHIYAVDGSDLDLPASRDVIKAGYRGSPWCAEYETHYPKMHVVHALDVLNGLVCDFSQSTRYAEKSLAKEITTGFEKKSLTIYDRLFCGYPTFKSHIDNGNYFLCRAVTSPKRAATCVRDFLESDRVDQQVIWKPWSVKKADGLEVRLIKVRHPKTKEVDVFVTNAPRSLFTRLELEQLYLKRWEIETSFKDLVDTMKMDQWHSTKVNGILQEIFCLLWITNAVKMHLAGLTAEASLKRDYHKSNFKLCMALVMDHLDLLLKRRLSELTDKLEYWTRKTRERRRHRSRSYPRVVRRYGTGFNVANKALKSARSA